MRIQSILIIFVARMERSVIRVSLANAEWVVSIINVKETRITLRCTRATVFDFELSRFEPSGNTVSCLMGNAYLVGDITCEADKTVSLWVDSF